MKFSIKKALLAFLGTICISSVSMFGANYGASGNSFYTPACQLAAAFRQHAQGFAQFMADKMADKDATQADVIAEVIAYNANNLRTLNEDVAKTVTSAREYFNKNNNPKVDNGLGYSDATQAGLAELVPALEDYTAVVQNFFAFINKEVNFSRQAARNKALLDLNDVYAQFATLCAFMQTTFVEGVYNVKVETAKTNSLFTGYFVRVTALEKALGAKDEVTAKYGLTIIGGAAAGVAALRSLFSANPQVDGKGKEVVAKKDSDVSVAAPAVVASAESDAKEEEIAASADQAGGLKAWVKGHPYLTALGATLLSLGTVFILVKTKTISPDILSKVAKVATGAAASGVAKIATESAALETTKAAVEVALKEATNEVGKDVVLEATKAAASELAKVAVEGAVSSGGIFSGLMPGIFSSLTYALSWFIRPA